ENPLSVVESSSFYDVQEFLSITNHVYSPAGLLINMDTWDSLSEEQQEIVMKAADEGKKVNRELNKENDEELVEVLKEKGMKVNEITELEPFQEKSKVVWESLTDELGEEVEDIISQILETQN